MPVHGDGDDCEGGVVDGEAGPRLGHAAQEQRLPPERPVLGQYVRRGQQHREAHHCNKEVDEKAFLNDFFVLNEGHALGMERMAAKYHFSDIYLLD